MNAAAAIAALAAVSPAARTPRSPTLSESSPHGSKVTTEPMLKAARTTPICVSESPYSSRSCGASTGIPRKTAE